MKGEPPHSGRAQQKGLLCKLGFHHMSDSWCQRAMKGEPPHSGRAQQKGLLCKLGFHHMSDSWCQRDGCNYHDVNC